jgi:hypothetical protein
MKRHLWSKAACLAVMLMCAPAMLHHASAEEKRAPAQRELPPALAPTVNLTAEQRHIIKEIIKEIVEKDKNITRAGPDVDVTIGASVPQAVAIRPFPPEVSDKVPQVRAHSYFVKGNQIIVVNPKDQKIADVID